MSDDLGYPSSDADLPTGPQLENPVSGATEEPHATNDADGKRAGKASSNFLNRGDAQVRAGESYSLSERLRRRQAYQAADAQANAATAPRPRDRAVTTSHKIAEAMREFVGSDGRTYAAIPMDLYAAVAEEESEQDVPEEEYDAEAAYVAWTALSEAQRIARITEAQAALDQLPGNDRAIMECVVQVAANARAGLRAAAQRTRQYFTIGDEVILRSEQVFTTEHFEALLFGRDDELNGSPSLTAAQLEQCDEIVLGHLAVLTTGGTPVMPDDAVGLAAATGIGRAPQASVGRFGVMTRDLDDEGNIQWGALAARNFRVALRRYGPLALIGLGWLWKPVYSRAEALRQMAYGVGPAPMRDLASRRGLFFSALGAAVALILLVALVFTVSSFGQWRQMTQGYLPSATNDSSGRAACNPCTTDAPSATVPGDATATASSTGAGCGAGCANSTPPPGVKPTAVPPTSTPLPGARPADNATVTFTAASKQVASDGAMSACPSGCVVAAPVGSDSAWQTASRSTTGCCIYTRVTLRFSAFTAFDGTVGASGGGMTCASWHITLGSGQAASVTCSPSSAVGAHTFRTVLYYGCGGVCNQTLSVDNPSGSYGDDQRTISQSDCDGANSDATNKAQAWGASYAPPASPAVDKWWGTDSQGCPPGVGARASSVTGWALGHVSYQSYKTTDAQNIAASRLGSMLQSGYVWKSRTTCSPTNTTPDRSTHTFSVTCSDSGVMVWDWNAGAKSGLSSSLANLSKSAALARCQAAAGISGGCTISLSGGDGATMPSSGGAISIQVQ